MCIVCSTLSNDPTEIQNALFSVLHLHHLLQKHIFTAFFVGCQLPVTRAKSPNLTRRKSCGDATHSSLEKGACTRRNRHSLDIYKEGNSNVSNIRNKNQINGWHGNGSCKVKDRSKLENEKPKTLSQIITEQRTADISAES